MIIEFSSFKLVKMSDSSDSEPEIVYRRSTVRKTGIPVSYPKFDYEAHGFVKEDLPSCVRIVLEGRYRTLENREFFLEDFGYKYLKDKEFRKEVKDMVLVLERHMYVAYMTESEHMKKESPYTKCCIRIKQQPILVLDRYRHPHLTNKR